MRVLVTGGAGYIGSVVAAQLVAAGHEVTVLDDLSTGFADAVPPGAAFVKGTLRDCAAEVLCDGVEAVLHFAAKSLVGESVADPAKYWSNNLGGTVALLEAMRECGSGRSSSPPPPPSTASPSARPSRRPIPTRPTSPYGASKLAVDTTLTEFAGCTGSARSACATSTWPARTRPPTGRWLGERHDPETHLIPNVLAGVAEGRPVRIFGDDYPTPDGTCVRDYIHVTDLADAHLRALAACRPGRHRIYNLGNGAGFSVREVIEVCREVTGADIGVDVAPRRPATRPCWSPRPRRSSPSWAGGRSGTCAPWPPTPGRSPRPARTRGEGGRALPGAVRRDAGRRVAGAGAGQPDGRAHRLQRRVRAPVRARPGRQAAAARRGPGGG